MQSARLLLMVIALLSFASTILAQEATILEHGSPIQSVEFSPVDNSLVVSGAEDHTIKLWDLQNNTTITLKGHTGKVNAVAFSPDGQLLASGSDDQTFKLWSIPEQQHIATFEHTPIIGGTPSLVTSVDFSPDGQTLATAGYQSVKLWNVNNQTEIATLQHDDWVYAIVFSPNGKYLAAIDGKQTKIWNIRKQQFVVQLEGDKDSTGAIAFSPDSQTFADAGSDGQIRLRSVSNWEIFGRIHVYSSVLDLAFSPNGKTLASAAHRAELWGTEDGRKIADLTGPTGWVGEVAFSPDGKTLASGGPDDGILHVQDVETLIDSQPPPNIVRIVYFVPNDRTPQSDINTKIETLMEATQTFFADTMERHGYGRKTFTYETDAEGKAIVHHITGQFTDAHYDRQNKWKVWDEIKEAGFDPTKNIYVAVMDFSKILDGVHCGTGGNWEHGGVVNLVASEECLGEGTENSLSGVALVTHEIGHAFGLQHDNRNQPANAIVLGETDDPMVASAGATEWLNVHPYFNNQPTYFNEPTAIAMWPPRAANPEGIRLGFTITDLDGLHQVQLLSTNLQEDYFAGRDYLEEQDYLDQHIIDLQSLNGTTATAEFITTQFTADNDTVVLRVIDVNGNFTEGRFPIDTTALPQYVEDVNGDHVVNSQDLVLVAVNFEQTGPNIADVNKDGVVNILDLLLVAEAFGKGAAAPSTWHSVPETTFTRADVQEWLDLARQANLTDPAFQRGILMLEQLLVALTTPRETALLPNYPNPFNPETWIPYQLAKPTDVRISIYSVEGKLVRMLKLGNQPMGIYASRSRAAYWDGKNELGEPVASGVYFYTLTTGNFTATRKMLIRK